MNDVTVHYNEIIFGIIDTVKFSTRRSFRKESDFKFSDTFGREEFTGFSVT